MLCGRIRWKMLQDQTQRDPNLFNRVQPRGGLTRGEDLERKTLQRISQWRGRRSLRDQRVGSNDVINSTKREKRERKRQRAHLMDAYGGSWEGWNGVGTKIYMNRLSQSGVYRPERLDMADGQSNIQLDSVICIANKIGRPSVRRDKPPRLLRMIYVILVLLQDFIAGSRSADNQSPWNDDALLSVSGAGVVGGHLCRRHLQSRYVS